MARLLHEKNMIIGLFLPAEGSGRQKREAIAAHRGEHGTNERNTRQYVTRNDGRRRSPSSSASLPPLPSDEALANSNLGAWFQDLEAEIDEIFDWTYHQFILL
jgi:hypothetical protein